MAQSSMSVTQGLRLLGLSKWDLCWHQVRNRALGCPARRLCFLKCFCAAERSREHLQEGLAYRMDALGSEVVFEKHGNWLSRGVFPGFVKCSEVRGAEERLNYLGR